MKHKAQNPQEFFLKELFPIQGNQKNLNLEIVSRMAKILELTFVSEPEAEGNVCMANNEEVRDDFRLSFTPMDIGNYIYAVLNSPAYLNEPKNSMEAANPKIPYPAPEDFWELVRQGRKLREKQGSHRGFSFI